VNLLSLVAAAALAAAPAPKKVLPGLLIDLKAEDGWALKAKHLPARDDKPTLLLLHGTGQRKEDWYLFTKTLASWGYGYLALDFRGHGESSVDPDGQPASWKRFKISKTENEFLNMTRDVQAAVSYLNGQGVPEEKIPVIGADVGSSLGLKFAAVHPKIPLVVLLSPGLSYQEVLTVNAMRAYKNRPILMVYSEADKNAVRATPLLQGFAKISAGAANTTVVMLKHEHGTKMFQRHRELGKQILDWIQQPVALPAAVSTDTAVGSPDGSQSSGPAEGPYPVEESMEVTPR
jgi:alpha-beta hydrolase superfamily lysophospholipase